jgi:hypothetical protein
VEVDPDDGVLPSPPADRPDAMIQAGKEVGFLGAGVYGGGQKVKAFGKPGATKHFRIAVENAGADDDLFIVQGCAPQSGVFAAFVHDGVDVTDEVTSGTFETSELEPGASTTIELRLGIKKKADVRNVRCRIAVTSGDDRSVRDTVVAKVGLRDDDRDPTPRFCRILIGILGVTGEDRTDLIEKYCTLTELASAGWPRPPATLDAMDPE